MRGRLVAAALAVALGAAGCAADPRPGAPAPSGSDGRASGVPPSPLSWEFTHLADFDGTLTSFAALAEDDVWAVGSENVLPADPHLLHFDGTRWKDEPLPDALGEAKFRLRFEVIGERELWLGPADRADEAASWARWDGTRWSAVPNPPPAPVGDLEAAGPDDIWALSEGQTALHWNGARWNSVPLPYPAADLAVAGPDDAWAVGHRGTGPGTEPEGGLPYTQPATMHWDGATWKPVATPLYRFDDPVPPEAGASLDQVFVLDGGEILAHGRHSYNHGEVENEPPDEAVRLRWDGEKWVERQTLPDRCDGIPAAQDGEGLFLLNGSRYLTEDGRCLKLRSPRLPLSTGARKDSRQSLSLEEIRRVPGTEEWFGAGHVQVNQSGDPFGAPVVVRLKRRG
ncbi:hypothetical protein [Streptomyces sp. NPDC056600]|uniref:hypothetical protein n=1 Tax=Streptomyces sp. NPDC056600 TaxID=3345874 RepID=UPI00367D799C